MHGERGRGRGGRGRGASQKRWGNAKHAQEHPAAWHQGEQHRGGPVHAARQRQIVCQSLVLAVVPMRRGSLVFPGVQNCDNINKLCLHVHVLKC